MAHSTPTIEAEKRDKLGSRYSLRLRQAGRLPAVVYGHQQDPVHISLDAKSFGELLHHAAHLVELKVDGAAESCLIKDVQYDYLDTTPIHVDLTRVNLDEEIQLELEVEFKGEPAVLETQDGAMLTHPHNTVTISCKANNIPESLTCDCSGLGLEDQIYARDLQLPDGVTLASEGDVLLAHIFIQQAVVDDEPDDAEAGDEPQVIGKDGDDDKNEEDGEE